LWYVTALNKKTNDARNEACEAWKQEVYHGKKRQHCEGAAFVRAQRFHQSCYKL